MAGGSSVQKRERSRCAGIVRDRRATVERNLIAASNKKMNEDHKTILRRVIKLLQELEAAILDMPQAYVPKEPQYQGDFSVEEMERAQAIIEEQEHNPFEGIKKNEILGRR